MAMRGIFRLSRFRSWLMRRDVFVLSELSLRRAMPIGVSCLLHAGLIAGLMLAQQWGQQWAITAVAVQPPVLPVRLVTLDAAEARPEPPPPAPP
ncbi:MAG: hypothetical protein ACREKJ_12695, partial [Candidatus Rokuibacteriota bacterium]